MFLCLLLSRTRISTQVRYLFNQMFQIYPNYLFWLNLNGVCSSNLITIIKHAFSMSDPKIFKTSNLFMEPKILGYYPLYFYSSIEPNRFFVELGPEFSFQLYCENLYHYNLFSKVYFMNCFIYLDLKQQQKNFSANLNFFCHTQKVQSRQNQSQNFQQKYMFHFFLHIFSSLLFNYVKIIDDLVNLTSYLNFEYSLHFYNHNNNFRHLLLLQLHYPQFVIFQKQTKIILRVHQSLSMIYFFPLYINHIYDPYYSLSRCP